MNETELRKQIEEQLSKYNNLKKPFVSRSAGVKHSYGWFGDNGPSIAWTIWAIAFWGSLLLYMLPLPKFVHSISLGVMCVALLLTLFVGIIGNIGEKIWKTNEPRKNRKIEIENRKLYKQLLGIEYNYPNYNNVDYIISVLHNEIVQEVQEVPENPRKPDKYSYTYRQNTRNNSTQNQSQNTERKSRDKKDPSNNGDQTCGHDKTAYSNNRSSQGNSQLCPECGGKLIMRKGPYA